MSLDDSYLRYEHRGYGMDHDRYDWSMLADRKPITWPNDAKLAVWIDVSLQHFPLNQSNKPFPPPGGMTTAYPDLRHFTLRDYGNRVGIVRVLQAIDAAGLTPTFSVNASLCETTPHLIERIAARGNEVIASSWHMDTLHHSGMPEEEEADLIERSLQTLRAATGQPITGWLSPARSQSFATPDLIKEAGIVYMADWVNDDLPYPFRTRSGELTALPLSHELDDQFIMQSNLHSEQEYADQICDAADYLLAEAEQTGHGRMLALSVHPWLVGQPHRIAAFERVLAHLADRAGIWSASAGDIVSTWRSQQ